MRIGKKIVDIPLLADGVVRYIGEKVAAVAAETEEAAERAVDLIDVEYEELPVVADPLEAVQSSAPLLHPDVADYKGLLHKIEVPSNVFVHLTWNKGDVEEGFRQSDVVVENTFQVPAVHQAYIEPHSCVVQVKARRRRRGLGFNQEPVRHAGASGKRSANFPHGHCDSSLLCRRGFRRKGRCQRSRSLLCAVEEEWPPGEIPR